jgi:hypothetical protein
MHFRHPSEEISFNVPDDWLALAGAQDFKRASPSFSASSDPRWPTVLLPIVEVDAPVRDVGIVGLHEERTISILQAIVAAEALPPIEVHQTPSAVPGRLSVRDGYHRYFLSIALGFTMVPVSIRPYFNFDAL